MTRFLSFIVETALAGKSDTIKAYTIAVEAFGRDSNFDPQSDPIVRVEAGRLRQALTRYYAGAGRDDPVLIELPRGAYVPSFQRGAASTAPQIEEKGPSRHPDDATSENLEDEASRTRQISCNVSHLSDRKRFGRDMSENFNLAQSYRRQVTSFRDTLRATRETLSQSRDLLKASNDLAVAGITLALLTPGAPSSGDDASSKSEDTGKRLLAQEERSRKPHAPLAQSRIRGIASAIHGTRANGKVFRVVLYAISVLAILEVLFDIDQPLTGGPNRGLFFTLWPMHSAVAAQSPTVTGEPIVIVEPVLAFGDRPPDLASPGMIRERLFDALARFDEVTVVPGPPHEGPDSPSASESGPNSKAQPPYYRLSSTVSYYPESVFTLAVRVIDTADGTVAWTNSYDRLPEQGRHEGHISSDVARTLFQPFGIIQAREAIKRAAADPMGDPYRCILDANVYLRSFDPSLYGSTRGCLERATANNPPLVGVFVKLARLYFRDYQIGASAQAGDRATLDRAYRMAMRAVDIKPNSAAAQFAMGEILLARGDFEQAKVAEDNALRLNPYDNAVIYGDAALLILSGQLDEGLAVLRQNTNKKTAVWAGHHFLVALGSYLKGDLTTAAIEAGQIANANFPPGLVLDAIIAANNKDRPRARYDIALLYGKNPSWRTDPHANISYFLPDRDMANRIGEDFAAVTDDLKKHADVVGSVRPAERP